MEEIRTLSTFIIKAVDWVERASRITSRKSKKRKGNESLPNEAKHTLFDVEQLIKEYESLSFDTPEFQNLCLLANGVYRFINYKLIQFFFFLPNFFKLKFQ